MKKSGDLKRRSKKTFSYFEFSTITQASVKPTHTDMRKEKRKEQSIKINREILGVLNERAKYFLLLSSKLQVLDNLVFSQFCVEGTACIVKTF